MSLRAKVKTDRNGHYIPIWFDREALPVNFMTKDVGEENYENEIIFDLEDECENGEDGVEFSEVESDCDPWSGDSESENDIDGD